MKITEYLNTNDEPMVFILDKENDKAESMPKSEYDRRQAEQSTPMVTDDPKS